MENMPVCSSYSENVAGGFLVVLLVFALFVWCFCCYFLFGWVFFTVCLYYYFTAMVLPLVESLCNRIMRTQNLLTGKSWMETE